MNEGMLTIHSQQALNERISYNIKLVNFNDPVNLNLMFNDYQVENIPLFVDETTEIPFEKEEDGYYLQLPNYLDRERTFEIKI
jgi:hypothetical protein